MDNRAAMVAVHEVKHLEQQWKEQMRKMLTSGLSPDLLVEIIGLMTVVQGQLTKSILKFEEMK